MRLPALPSFRALKSFNYRLWAAGAVVSNIGTWMQRTAQGWLVLTQLTHHDASALGLTMALQFAPPLLFLPLTGYVADHFNQRRLIMLTQACMGCLALTLGILTVTGFVSLWLVYLFAFLFGTASAFDAPTRQTFVSELAGDRDLSNAVALNSLSFNGARMVGPAVAGLVISAAGTGWAFIINGLSFGAVLCSLLFLRKAELTPNARAHRARGGFTEGFRYVWGRPDLRAIMCMLFVIGTFGMNFQLYIPAMATGAFHVNAEGFGLLSSFMAIGTILGAFAAAARIAPRFMNLLSSSMVFAIGCLFSAIAPGYWYFAAALVLTGIASMTFNNTTNSLAQLSTTPSLRGRVMAIRMAIAMGGTPIGAPMVGWITDQFGPRWGMSIGAMAGTVATIIALHAITRRHHEVLGGG